MQNYLKIESVLTKEGFDILMSDQDESVFGMNGLYLNTVLMNFVAEHKTQQPKGRQKARAPANGSEGRLLYTMYLRAIQNFHKANNEDRAVSANVCFSIGDRLVGVHSAVESLAFDWPDIRSAVEKLMSEVVQNEGIQFKDASAVDFIAKQVGDVIGAESSSEEAVFARKKFDELMISMNAQGNALSTRTQKTAAALQWLRELVQSALCVAFGVPVSNPWSPAGEKKKKKKKSGIEEEEDDLAEDVGSQSSSVSPRTVARALFKEGSFSEAFDPAELGETLGNSRIKMIWTDPPFNVRREDHDKVSVETVLQSFEAIPDELFDTKAVGFICCAWQSLGQIAGYWKDRGWNVSKTKFVWVASSAKHGKGSVHPACPRNAHTDILFVYRGTSPHTNWEHSRDPLRFFDVIDRAFPDTKERVYGVDGKALRNEQKPLSLLKEFIWRYTDADDWIVDPFAGTGTTLAAAMMTGRNSIGCDTDPIVCQAVADRLSKVSEGIIKGSTTIEKDPTALKPKNRSFGEEMPQEPEEESMSEDERDVSDDDVSLPQAKRLRIISKRIPTQQEKGVVPETPEKTK